MSESIAMPKHEARSTRQVGDVFRDVPLTREHLKCCLALFFVFAIEAWEMMIIVYTAPLIAQDFALDALAVGHLIGAMFIGMLLGSLIWGKLAERIGRKGAVIWSLASYGVISLASAFAPDYITLYVLRLLSGVAAVGMMVVTFAHYQELLPVRQRGALTVYLASGWPIGMLLALGATVWLMPYGWRTVIAV
ncbi:MFS transporter, partial [Pseudomonas sp. 24 E 13]